MGSRDEKTGSDLRGLHGKADRCAELEQQLEGRKQMGRRQGVLPSYQGDQIPLGRCVCQLLPIISAMTIAVTN